MGRNPTMAVIAACAVLIAGSHSAHSQQSVADFYRGKQIRVIISAAPATDYDMFARLISAQMTKTLPGNPTFLHQNMPGAGGIIATNNLYNIAPKDGTVIGMVNRNMPHVALTKMANVQFDPVKFNWLGSPEVSHSVCVALTGVPVQKAEDLFQHELLIGGAGSGSAPSITSNLLSNLLGMKFKLVEGYKSVPDVSLAMMRKEVHGVCQSLNALQGGNLAGWIAADKLKVLFNLEPKPLAEPQGRSHHLRIRQDRRAARDPQSQRLDLHHGPADADPARRARRPAGGAAQVVHRGGQSSRTQGRGGEGRRRGHAGDRRRDAEGRRRDHGDAARNRCEDAEDDSSAIARVALR